MENTCHVLIVMFVLIVGRIGFHLTEGCDKFADEKDPQIFHTTVHGKQITMTCSPGTVFNQDGCTCDYFPSPRKPKECHRKPDPVENNMFSVNVHGVETKMECAPGTVYIPDLCDCGYQ